MAQGVAWPSAVLGVLLLVTPLLYARAFRDYALVPRLCAMLLGAGALGVCELRARTVAWRITPLHVLLAALLAYSAASLSWGPNVAAGTLTWLKWAAAAMIFWYVSQQSDRLVPGLLARGLAASGLLVGALGVAQHLGWQPIHAPSAGLPSATLGFRNVAAMYLAGSIPLLAAYVACATRTRDRVLGAASLALMGPFLVFTRTRGAWVGLGAAALLAIVLTFIRRRTFADSGAGHRLRWIALAGLTTAAAFFIPSGLGKLGPQSIDEKKADTAAAIRSAFTTDGDRGRLQTWRISLGMVADHPLRGVGLGNWATYYPAYDRGARITFDNAPERAHSEPITFLTELGVVGASLALAVVIAAAFALRNILRAGDVRRGIWVVAAFSSLTAIWVHGGFSFPSERPVPLLLTAVCLGMLAAWSRPTAEGTCSRTGPVPVAALLLLLVVGYGAFRVGAFEAAMARAVARELRGDWEGVAAETAAAIDAGPFHPEVYHLRGYALNTLSRYDASVEMYRGAVDARPYDVQILNGYALALQGSGRPEEAARQFEAALAIVPGMPDVLFNLAGVRLTLGQPAEAADLYGRALEAEGPSADLLFRLGNARARAGRDTTAIEALRGALAMRPFFLEAQFVLAEVYFRNGDAERARPLFESFLTLIEEDNPYTRVARSRIATIERQQQEEHP